MFGPPLMEWRGDLIDCVVNYVVAMRSSIE
jgi:hypothetical protein